MAVENNTTQRNAKIQANNNTNLLIENTLYLNINNALRSYSDSWKIIQYMRLNKKRNSYKKEKTKFVDPQ